MRSLRIHKARFKEVSLSMPVTRVRLIALLSSGTQTATDDVFLYAVKRCPQIIFAIFETTRLKELARGDWCGPSFSS
jgi:hypothetical protein